MRFLMVNNYSSDRTTQFQKFKLQFDKIFSAEFKRQASGFRLVEINGDDDLAIFTNCGKRQGSNMFESTPKSLLRIDLILIGKSASAVALLKIFLTLFFLKKTSQMFVFGNSQSGTGRSLPGTPETAESWSSSRSAGNARSRC